MTNQLVSADLRSDLAGWAGPWSRLGLWLCAWNKEGELVEPPTIEHAFWTTLLRCSAHFRERLRSVILETSPDKPQVCELEPCSGVLVVSMAFQRRGEPAIVLTGCALAPAFSDEENLLRFASRYQIDGTVLNRLTVDEPRLNHGQLDAWSGILRQYAAQFHEVGEARQEIDSLSSHLATTYEELHLLYQMSTSMSVHRKPEEHFHELCENLLSTTVVRGFVVILQDPAVESSKPSMVHAGQIDATYDELIRLLGIVKTRTPNAGQCVVIDDAAADGELAWTSGWLKQCVFYPLSKRGRCFGGLLAINHVDATQFNSYEIQLISALTERSSAFLENVQLYRDLESLFSAMMHALVSSIDAKDPYTCGHSQRVAWLSRRIAQLLGLSEHQTQRVYLSGLLHDIGKIGIPEAVLCKTGRLSREEFSEIRKHPQIGARIIQGVPQVAYAVPGVLYHHERMDGKGYPSGLAGHAIPLLGRIIGLADSYDAMTTNRTYRQARPVIMAAVEIRRCSGTQFDSAIADLFLQQDLPAMHQEVTEFGNLPIDHHPGLGLHYVSGGEA